jgi:hypothetical protein
MEGIISNCFKCKYLKADLSRRRHGEEVTLCSKGRWQTIYNARLDKTWYTGEKPSIDCPDYQVMRG